MGWIYRTYLLECKIISTLWHLNKQMIDWLTKKYQFATRLQLNNNILDTLNETKLLGLIISSDLTWHKNTKMLVQKGFARKILLKKLFEFNVPQSDLVTIYILYIRSILEQSSVIWHTSLSQENIQDLERVQKSALKIIRTINAVKL